METEDAIDKYDEIIHHDARNGYQISLEAYLKHKPECLNRFYQFGESKWTILIAACYFQHEAIVRMLVNQFNVDVEAEGTIVMNTRDTGHTTIERVTPLWVAAAVNNLNIVKFLVQFGRANVNHLTEERSTPFRAACYNGNIEMAKFLVHHGANPHRVRLNNYTNLTLAILNGYTNLVHYLVDDLKCDINQEDVDGQTALHTAVEYNNILTARFLIDHGALNLRDKSRNLTPLMLAAVQGKTRYVTAFDGHCSDIDWIEAHELLGSSFAGCLAGTENMNTAVEYFTLAFEARTAKNIPKLCSQQTSAVFDHRQESETLQDLNQLVSFGSRENFYIEALLIQERILGTGSKFYHESLRNIGYRLMDIHQYELCFRLWFYELDLRRQRRIPFERDDLRWFVNLCEELFSANQMETYINQFCTLLSIMTETLSTPQDNETFDFNLVTLSHLVTISAELLLTEHSDDRPKLSLENSKILFKHIRSIVRKDYATKDSGASLLHLCCTEDTTSPLNLFRYVLELESFP